MPHNGTFRIGSVTKPFVATVALQLAGEGKIDLDTFLAALLGGKLLKPSQQQELTRTTAVSPDYGLGVSVTPLSCTTIYGHDGSIPGYGAMMVGTSNKRVALSVTESASGGDPGDGYFKLLETAFC